MKARLISKGSMKNQALHAGNSTCFLQEALGVATFLFYSPHITEHPKNFGLERGKMGKNFGLERGKMGGGKGDPKGNWQPPARGQCSRPRP